MNKSYAKLLMKALASKKVAQTADEILNDLRWEVSDKQSAREHIAERLQEHLEEYETTGRITDEMLAYIVAGETIDECDYWD